MKIKIIIWCSIPLLILGCANYPSKMSKSNIYKEYALCQCLKAGYAADSLMRNDISVGVYQDLSEFSIIGQTSNTLDSIGKLYGSRVKPSQIADYHGKKATFFDCMQFFHSKTLDSLVKKIK